MWRRRSGIAVLALAVMLALAPATPRAEVRTAAPNGAGRAVKYIACAGSIVFMVAVPASIFYTTLVCINAFLSSND
jgi:hypothetical protein